MKKKKKKKKKKKNNNIFWFLWGTVNVLNIWTAKSYFKTKTIKYSLTEVSKSAKEKQLNWLFLF